jgi:hypothetical protein
MMRIPIYMLNKSKSYCPIHAYDSFDMFALEHLNVFFSMPFKKNTRKNNIFYQSKKIREKTKKRKY